MRKNYYGRRRWDSRSDSNSDSKSSFNNKFKVKSKSTARQKYQDLTEKARLTSDLIAKINLLQRAEHWLKVSNDQVD